MDNHDRPKLRMIEAHPVSLKEGHYILLRDPVGISAHELLLPWNWAFCSSCRMEPTPFWI